MKCPVCNSVIDCEDTEEMVKLVESWVESSFPSNFYKKRPEKSMEEWLREHRTQKGSAEHHE